MIEYIKKLIYGDKYNYSDVEVLEYIIYEPVNVSEIVNHYHWDSDGKVIITKIYLRYMKICDYNGLTPYNLSAESGEQTKFQHGIKVYYGEDIKSLILKLKRDDKIK